MSKVSVIVPVYNVEKYLHRCIDSILAQTYGDFELILVDDGSTDSSGTICDSYALKDSRVKVIHQANQGQAAARNRALNLARGEYIAFVDSDDYIHPQMMETLLCNALSNRASISICGHRKVEKDTAFPPLLGEAARCWNGKEYIRKCFLEEIPNKAWILCDKLFHRSCFGVLRLPAGRIYEDNAVVYKLIYEAERIAECDEELYHYYQHESSTVNQPFQHKHLDWLKVLEEMRAYFSQHGEQTMVDFVDRRRLNSLAYLYRQSRKYLRDPDVERKLRNELKRHFFRERKKYPITIQTHPYIIETMYPVYAFCYWTYQGLRGKFTKR